MTVTNDVSTRTDEKRKNMSITNEALQELSKNCIALNLDYILK